VRRLMELLRLRATHPAFGGELSVETTSPTSLRMTRSAGRQRLALHVDLVSGRSDIT
jgi:hypothetical protein